MPTHRTLAWAAYCLWGRAVTYLEKLRDPRWQRKRLEILDRDGWKCQRCDSATKTLHVHHTAYRRGADPWDYPGDALLTLCEDCHDAEHASPEDVEREGRIRVHQRAMEAADHNGDDMEGIRQMEAMFREIGERSPAQVRRMERAKGLR